MDPIYLDHNATTPIDPDVATAISDCYAQGYVNPASQHWMGQAARLILDSHRIELAKLINANIDEVSGDQLIFTSGGTESNNLAMLGLVGEEPGRVLISSIEHPSVVGAAAELARRGFEIATIPVGTNGQIESEAVRDLLTDDTRLVSCMLANNETGVIQPVQTIGAICAESEVPFHVDAVQAVGKIGVDFSQLLATTISMAAHKFHGPRGIGALVVQRNTQLHPILHGGFQQDGIRPGTEDIALAVGMTVALRKATSELEQRYEKIKILRDHFEQRLREVYPPLIVVGDSTSRLPQTSNISFVGKDRQALLMALDFQRIACSTGSACASGSSEPSPVLQAMGLPEEVVAGSLRFSFGIRNSMAEIDDAISRISLIFKNL